MILKGNQRANGRELALHLLNVADNEHAVLHELRGFLANDLIGAFKETEAVSLGTKCQQYLFSLSLNPPPSAKVSIAEFEAVIDQIERRMQLKGQPRAIVFHEKKGRRHAHCVWSRIDVAHMRAINLPHFKRRLQNISREVFLGHGWDMPAGLRDAKDCDPLNYTASEASQAKRISRDPATLKEILLTCWTASDSKTAFAHALREQGFCLARGDRRGFVAVDAQGEVYSLSRWLSVKPKKLRARLGRFEELPDVEEAVSRLIGAADLQKIGNSPTRSARLAELVSRQRKERVALQTSQEARRLTEISARQSQLPTGMKAVWAKLTGQYQKLEEVLALEAAACARRDQAEHDALIARHLSEHQRLDQGFAVHDAQTLLTQELHDRDARDAPTLYLADPRQPLIVPRDIPPFTKDELRNDPALILTHISDKKAHFGQNDVLRALAQVLHDPLDLRIAADQAMASSQLIPLGDGKFTTQDFLACEQSLNQASEEMVKSGGFKVRQTHVDQAINAQDRKLQSHVGATLSDEQVTAIRHVLDPHQLSAVVGLAGAGKSTLLAAAKEAWDAQGFGVYGAALAGKAADSLQSASGITSRTLASMEASWQSGYEPVPVGSIVVIDEAGMVSTRQLDRVTQALQQRGCKVVLIGDPDQLQPIQAGTPFRDIIQNCGAARLNEIRRQQTDWQRQASHDLAAGRTSEALQAYAEHGAVNEAEDRDHAIAALVEDYMADRKTDDPNISRLALAHRRIDVHAINQGIREIRKAEGELTTDKLFQTDHGPRAFGEGDRIVFTRNNRDLGVKNGSFGTVEAVDNEHLKVHLDTDDGHPLQVVSINTRDYASYDHGYACTIHKAQGATVDRSYVLGSSTMDFHLTNVALTRHRAEMRLYADCATLRRMKRESEFEPETPSFHRRHNQKYSGPFR